MLKRALTRHTFPCCDVCLFVFEWTIKSDSENRERIVEVSECLYGIVIVITECHWRLGLNCSHHCTLGDNGRATCSCPPDTHALNRSDSTHTTCYPLGKTWMDGWMDR